MNKYIDYDNVIYPREGYSITNVEDEKWRDGNFEEDLKQILESINQVVKHKGYEPDIVVNLQCDWDQPFEDGFEVPKHSILTFQKIDEELCLFNASTEDLHEHIYGLYPHYFINNTTRYKFNIIYCMPKDRSVDEEPDYYCDVYLEIYVVLEN